MSLETQTKKIMKDAIARYALENEVNKERIQLLIYTDNPDLEPRYKVLKDISLMSLILTAFTRSFKEHLKILAETEIQKLYLLIFP